mmetsp:Transcript_2738/g.8323  ORF Transcript_2738/g.8323 Transcript_2738/m.8323 type:complete len:207 (-) Transcript_2738:2458-3078(-)
MAKNNDSKRVAPRTTSPIQPRVSSVRIFGTKINPNTVIILIRMFIDGPDVSLNGSPTVSPATVALCHSLPFALPFPKKPDSTNFFALSQAPPALDIMIPNMYPDPMAPKSRPTSARCPKPNPIMIGDIMAMRPGSTISQRAEIVEIRMHRSCSGRTPDLPSRRPGISLNCLLTSTIMASAALDTASMVSAPNRNGSMIPRRSDVIT